ncbi:Lrp/AsnC family transcriptional regulator [Orbus mooreae]|uniref:Lrp/AsnC family transcriptional regulator n=1 Tax=Orbus mooreae TaxID=3074107 RepID=UPI00370DE077
MDKKDLEIVSLLTDNSRLSWKNIGDQVYLSGQAVGSRVQQLIDDSIIEKFTIKRHYDNLQFITIYMNSNQFTIFEQLVSDYDDVISMEKITGDGCYFIQSCFDHNSLEQFINTISPYARYKINHRLKTIK